MEHDVSLRKEERVMLIRSDVDEVLELDPVKRPRLDWSEYTEQSLVLPTIHQYAKAEIEKALQILEAFPEIPILDLTFERYDWHAHLSQLKRLKKILINSKKIKILRIRTLTSWPAISKALYQNTNITHLSFTIHSFHTTADRKAFNKVIKSLKRINHIRTLGLWYEPMHDKLFFSILEACSNMASFEEFELFSYSPTKMTEMYGLDEKKYKWPEKIQQIRDLLAKSPNLKKIVICRSDLGQDICLFTGMIQEKINSLQIIQTGIQIETKLIDAIRHSTTLTDLSLESALSSKSVYKIMKNKNIKSLSVRLEDSTDVARIEHSMATNNSLESLQLQYSDYNIATNMFKALVHNTTLKSLTLSGFEMDAFAFRDLLKSNSTITSYEFNIGKNTLNKKDDANAIVEGLGSNRTIKTYKSTLRGYEELIYRTIANHPSLTSFDNMTIDVNLHNIVIEMDSKNLLDLSVNESHGKVSEILRRNRKFNRVHRSKTIVGIIVLSRSPIFDYLPIEIWYKILTEVTIDDEWLAIDSAENKVGCRSQ